jgi:hypothetical protein
MRTPEEIVEYCKTQNDFFGFTREVLLPWSRCEDIAVSVLVAQCAEDVCLALAARRRGIAPVR